MIKEFIDETFASAGLKKQKGRFPKGQKLTTPQNRKYPRMTIIGAIRLSGFVRPSEIYNKGSIDTADFEKYVKQNFAPNLTKVTLCFGIDMVAQGEQRIRLPCTRPRHSLKSVGQLSSCCLALVSISTQSS